jgi:hypothetical protein
VHALERISKRRLRPETVANWPVRALGRFEDHVGPLGGDVAPPQLAVNELVEPAARTRAR